MQSPMCTWATGPSQEKFPKLTSMRPPNPGNDNNTSGTVNDGEPVLMSGKIRWV